MSCKEAFVTSVPESEANDIYSTLVQHNLPAAKTPVGDGLFTISIESRYFPEAMALLKQYGLPRENRFGYSNIFENQKGMVANPKELSAKLSFAASQELEVTLMKITGIHHAEVHLNIPEKENAFEETKQASASVLVRVFKPYFSADLYGQIKQIISFAVDGLDFNDVAVVIIPVAEPVPPQIVEEKLYEVFEMQIAGGIIVFLILTLIGFGVFIFKNNKKLKHANTG